MWRSPMDTITDLYTGIKLPLTYANTLATCSSQSTALSFWLSGGEATAYLEVAYGAVTFIDMTRVEFTGDFRFTQREIPFITCLDVQSDSSCGGEEDVANPCGNSSLVDDCLAIQWNNLAFGNGNVSVLTDGRNDTEASFVASNEIVINLNQTIVGDGAPVIFLADTNLTSSSINLPLPCFWMWDCGRLFGVELSTNLSRNDPANYNGH